MAVGVCWGAKPPQAQEQGASDEKQSSSKSQDKETIRPNLSVSDGEWEPSATSERGFKGLAEDFLSDQKHIWTSPAKIRFSDTQWLVPLSGITAGLFVTDRDFSGHLSHNPSTISHYNTLSNGGIGALIGGAGGMWLLGHVKHNSHWSETGFLAGEAAANSLFVVESMKYSLARERPFQGNGSGSFFQGGTSFPSEHAAAAWSVAGVIAHEYPGPLSKIAAYGLAALVDYSRIRARQHFPSDVFVGSVLGNLVAQNIYSRRHDPELGGGEWRSISDFVRGDGNLSLSDMGSPYVPLDSWIYPALDRLAGMGLINTEYVGLRPWTRRECARLLEEAGDRVNELEEGSSPATGIYDLLEKEFERDLEETGGGQNSQARVESVYTRVTGILGEPLTNGYVFGQTFYNDFGRPYQEGVNSVTGFSASGTYERWFGYIRAEYQQSPSAPPLSESTREAIANLRLPIVNGVPPATPFPAVNNVQLLDAYVGLNFSNWQVSFGRQSLSWGPGDGGSMTLSDNAQPLNMLRISRTSPLKLPSFLGWLGPIRTEFFLGQLAGQDFIFNPSGFVGQFGQQLSPQPFMHGQKLSFKPTKNLEFGFFRTTIYGGPGYPFTFHNFFRSVVSTGNTLPGQPDKPGKRTSGLDFSYRLPGFRKWLTFYADGVAWDQFSPIAYADRSAWRAGLFLSHFPRIPKLDLRMEGVYTNNPLGGAICCGFWYYDATWRSGYTNDGNIMGNWVGRDGQGVQAWMNYWLTAKNRIQLNYRHQKVGNDLLPGGGSLTDVGLRGDLWTSPELGFSANVQYETWNFPVIRPGQQTDVSASLQVTFMLKRWRVQGLMK
jgi:hypothetical protein